MDNERTMQGELERLLEAWLDFVFHVLKSLGVVALCKRLGLNLKPWALEREERWPW